MNPLTAIFTALAAVADVVKVAVQPHPPEVALARIALNLRKAEMRHEVKMARVKAR